MGFPSPEQQDLRFFNPKPSGQKDDTALIGGPLHWWGLDHEFRELVMETGPPCPFGPRLDPKGQ